MTGTSVSPPPDFSPLWTIEARKYDQSLHYVLKADLVEDNGERLWFRAQPGTLLHHVTRGWQRPLGYASEMIFWRGLWYNVYFNYARAGMPDHFYCNVGLPPAISDTTLTFVDLDLDVRIFLDGRFEILDADEFAEHSARYGYPKDVRDNASLAVLDILNLWRKRQPPFDK